MQIHHPFLNQAQGFSSPLRPIDQNMFVQAHHSPNGFQPFSSG